MASFYWALTTLMKTPWVGPDTIVEKVFASMAVLLGALLFAALLGNVTALMQSFERGNALKRDKMGTLHSFATSRKIPAVLQRRLFTNVDAEWNFTSGLNDAVVLAQLPMQMRGEVVASIHKDTLLKEPLFSRVSLECAKQLLLRLQPAICLQKEVLIARDQLCHELYVLISGAVQVAASSSAAEGALGAGIGGDDGSPVEAEAGMRSSRTSSGANGRGLKFRMVERMGALVGYVHPYERPVTRYPFVVTAVKQTSLVSISRAEIAEVLALYGDADTKRLLHVVQSEHDATCRALLGEQHAGAAAAGKAAGAAGAGAEEGGAGGHVNGSANGGPNGSPLQGPTRSDGGVGGGHNGVRPHSASSQKSGDHDGADGGVVATTGAASAMAEERARTLDETRQRVAAMEAALARCVSEMQATRECLGLLPSLIELAKESLATSGGVPVTVPTPKISAEA